jgi:hypothetical protein
MPITAPPNCAVRNRDENRAQNTWRTPESGVSLSQFYWRTRAIHQNAGVSRQKLARVLALDPELRLSNLKDRVGPYRPEDLARFADGMRLAGLPE